MRLAYAVVWQLILLSCEQVPGPEEFAAALPSAWVQSVMQPPKFLPRGDGDGHAGSSVERTIDGGSAPTLRDWLGSFWAQVHPSMASHAHAHAHAHGKCLFSPRSACRVTGGLHFATLTVHASAPSACMIVRC